MTEAYIDSLKMPPADEGARAEARKRWNAVAKPIGSLGTFEDEVVRIAALTGDANVCIDKRCIAVLCADNGVVAQGVSQSGSDVTTTVARNVAQGVSSVCSMCAPFGIDCLAVDMGMRERLDDTRIRDRRIGAGTADITIGAAMTRSQALQAIRTGVELVSELAAEGYRLVGVGEVGIGNTTTATAVACALHGLDPKQVTGRGAGLSDAGLRRKADAIERALLVNAPEANDVVGVLAKVGGYDLAGMCGMFLGGAVYRVPIVIDGLISSVAAECAVRLRSECASALIASHLSAEPVARTIMDSLGFDPPLHAHLHLGEGTGAACLTPLLDMALSLYKGTTFADCGLEPYEVDPQ